MDNCSAVSVFEARVLRYSDARIHSVAFECAICAYIKESFTWHLQTVKESAKTNIKIDSEVYVIMSLSIELNSESKKPRIFSQGELVSGKVIFNCSKSEEVAAIIISLKGEVHTRVYAGDIKSDRTYVCDTTICEINQTLFEGPYTVSAGIHEYAFQFTFPDHITEPIKHKFGQAPSFTSHIDDKVLPPSCEMEDKGAYGSNSGNVVYELHVKIPQDHSNPQPKTVSKPISHHLRVADDGISLRELTTGEAFKEKLHPSPKTRTVTFNVSVTAPTVIVPGEEFPLKLAIHPDLSSNDHGNYKQLPSLSLKEYHVSVQGRFLVRCDYTMFVRSNDEVGQCEKVVEVSKGTDSVPMTLDEAITLDTIMLDPVTFAPTFQSFQMTGSWSLHVRAKVLFAGKEFTVFILFDKVTLLSPKVRADMLGPAPDYNTVVASSKGEVPVYESSNSTTDMKKPFNPF
ncbi:hypothetical protein N431DRAFT_469874 [Stipitochalara longipes BDJ]|nr:hypothetical protein N431DRAFT_469874 [Stipitochalara longipes BDJ]